MCQQVPLSVHVPTDACAIRPSNDSPTTARMIPCCDHCLQPVCLVGFDLPTVQVHCSDDKFMCFLTMHPFHRDVALQLLNASDENIAAAKKGLLAHLLQLPTYTDSLRGHSHAVANGVASSLLYAGRLHSSYHW
jgi:hypothetical protein